MGGCEFRVGQVNHELLPFALGAAISPVPILALIMTVLANRACLGGGGVHAGPGGRGIALTCSLCVPLSTAIENRDRSV